MAKKQVFLGFMVVCATSFFTLAHEEATGVVKQRMDQMDTFKTAVKLIAPMIKGSIAFDAQAVEKAARASQGRAGEALTKLFPEGSLDKPSEAKPEIWENWDEFSKLADQLEMASAKLAAAAEQNDKAGVIKAFGGFAKTCKDCHTEFRIKK